MSSRRYIRDSRAWYASTALKGDTVESMTLSEPKDAPPEGQIELIVCWERIPDGARLCIYDESWLALMEWTDLWQALGAEAQAAGGMAGEYRCTPDEFEAILKHLGFVDRTPDERLED